MYTQKVNMVPSVSNERLPQWNRNLRRAKTNSFIFTNNADHTFDSLVVTIFQAERKMCWFHA